MLTRDFQQQRSGTEAKTLTAKYTESTDTWVDFCLFPDIVPPVRMPSLFPVPTHIFKRQAVFNVGLGAAEAGYNIRMLYSPSNLSAFDTNTPVRPVAYRKVNTASVNYNGFDTSNDNTVTINTLAVAGDTTAVQSVSLPSITNDVAHGGVRLIGAFIELEYIGTVENHSGVIEVGLHPQSRDDGNDIIALHFANDSEIIQMPFYRRYKPGDGARCIWFPVDQNDFMFCPVGLPINALIPTRPVALQWCININGLQPLQNLRVHVCNVYESIPDEAASDLFCPKREKQRITPDSARQAVSQLVNQGAATTPSKSAGVFQKMYDAIKSAAGAVVAPITLSPVDNILSAFSTASNIYSDIKSIF